MATGREIADRGRGGGAWCLLCGGYPAAWREPWLAVALAAAGAQRWTPASGNACVLAGV